MSRQPKFYSYEYLVWLKNDPLTRSTYGILRALFQIAKPIVWLNRGEIFVSRLHHFNCVQTLVPLGLHSHHFGPLRRSADFRVYQIIFLDLIFDKAKGIFCHSDVHIWFIVQIPRASSNGVACTVENVGAVIFYYGISGDNIRWGDWWCSLLSEDDSAVASGGTGWSVIVVWVDFFIVNDLFIAGPFELRCAWSLDNWKEMSISSLLKANTRCWDKFWLVMQM